MMKLKKKLVLLEQELNDWKKSGLEDLSDETEQKLKVLIRDWERKLALKEVEHSQVRPMIWYGIIFLYLTLAAFLRQVTGGVQLTS